MGTHRTDRLPEINGLEVDTGQFRSSLDLGALWWHSCPFTTQCFVQMVRNRTLERLPNSFQYFPHHVTQRN